jgi:DNA mismatch endonuclease (patch repair protein)
MQGNRSRDTAPEIALRKLLFARGLRYRVNYKPVKGRRLNVDIAFPGPRVVVLVDGCFWHGCEEHYREPKTNTDYWQAKIDRNRARDAEVDDLLGAQGWTVMRFWEHTPPETAATAITKAIKKRRHQH